MRSPEKAFDLRAALSQELRDAMEAFQASDDDPAALHRCRVHLKRARALARVGAVCAPGLAAVFNQSARTTMHALAPARTAAALEEAALKGAKKARRKSHATALNAVAKNLELNHISASDSAEAIRMALKDLLALAQVWPEASPRQIRRGALRLVRKARRAARRGVGAPDPERRHDWRKREKDRAYAAELLGDAWPRARRSKKSEKLGAALGEERDALLLMAQIAAEPALAGDDKTAARALKALNKRRAKFAARADDLAVALHAGGA